jgi:heterodisulfide reductase subunit A-like polyferredoxin
MWRGLRVFEELNSGLKSFMERKGYEKIEDFKGIALKYLTTVEELATREPMKASVNETLCNGCKICVTSCSYDAIQMEDNKARTNPEKCDGCGLCRAWCPSRAIELV